jgi:methylenetetrahydrofolate dehydrogenase (NADP+)/methenyltetrahydrofolate cyclohydrolase
MLLLDGKLVSQSRRQALRPRLEKFQKQAGRAVHLAVILVGEDPASQVYVRNKIKGCAELGIQSTRYDLPTTTTQTELVSLVLRLNQDDGVDGILVQRPLPKHLDENEIFEIISAQKDVDGFSYQALGHLMAGAVTVAPCTPVGIMSILEHYQISVAGMRAVVVGRSVTVGKPMLHLLTAAQATVTLCHSQTKDLRSYTREADLVVVAAGRKHLLGKEDFKKDAIVIDVGVHGSGSGQKLAGDVRADELTEWVKALTPVPGGVGPMTITSLFENTVMLAETRFAERK